jgi:hypothetical protein
MPRVGLRFRKGDARLLQALAERVRQGEIPGAVSTFEQAELAARTGEPLIVICEDPVEAHQMAALYARLGMKRPAVEELSGA